ncbi:MAG: M56 family metallopeptidase [Chitinophagales bacterium]|nr:M56 family metallopeptidase [Chitinophagales bacterium]
MLQYIINTTAIWLTGLIVFDLFLRREANHGYNRFYLLVILFAGALIPLWSWGGDSVIYNANISKPIAEQSAAIRQTIVEASEGGIIGWEQWLFIIYITGAAIVSVFLLKDLVNIMQLYRQGILSKDGTWTIIETGKAQSPFSAFRYVYISSKDNYTEEELRMILTHEEQHGHLLHFVDVLLVRLANIFFWFNPLIYILEKRLLMVHEYQADAAVSTTPSAYGQFLVEQSILGSAPVLAHSFTRSPLKKRILMLTRKTTALAKSKQLLLLPVLAIAMLSFTENSFLEGIPSPVREGNKVTYRGNTFEFPSSENDTVMVTDPTTGDMQLVITSKEPSNPNKMNDERVYMPGELQTSSGSKDRYTGPSSLNDQALKEYLLTNMKKEIKKLADGEYRLLIGAVVIDKKGNIVYFEFDSVEKLAGTKNGRPQYKFISEKINETFAKRTAVLLNNAPNHTPASNNGVEVNSAINNTAFWNSFKVKNGELVSL